MKENFTKLRWRLFSKVNEWIKTNLCFSIWKTCWTWWSALGSLARYYDIVDLSKNDAHVHCYKTSALWINILIGYIRWWCYCVNQYDVFWFIITSSIKHWQKIRRPVNTWYTIRCYLAHYYVICYLYTTLMKNPNNLFILDTPTYFVFVLRTIFVTILL